MTKNDYAFPQSDDPRQNDFHVVGFSALFYLKIRLSLSISCQISENPTQIRWKNTKK